MGLFHWFKKKKEKVLKKDRIKRKALARLGRIHRFDKKSIDKAHQHITEFFHEFFNLSYEFTHPELIEVIRKKRLKADIRNRLSEVIQSIEDFKYSNRKSSKEQKELIDNLKKIIKEL